MPGRVVGEAAKQRVSLVCLCGSDSGRCDAGVGLVDDDEFGTQQRELVASAALFDVVGGHDQVRVVLVDCRSERHRAGEPVSCRRQQHFGVDAELGAQFGLPLRRKLG